MRSRTPLIARPCSPPTPTSDAISPASTAPRSAAVSARLSFNADAQQQDAARSTIRSKKSPRRRKPRPGAGRTALGGSTCWIVSAATAGLSTKPSIRTASTARSAAATNGGFTTTHPARFPDATANPNEKGCAKPTSAGSVTGDLSKRRSNVGANGELSAGSKAVAVRAAMEKDCAVPTLHA